jgi:eukaryotic-like serine/threonine-protein kinase
LLGRTVVQYIVEAPLGQGGMGEVYLARDLSLGHRVALKVLLSNFADEHRDRLLLEARASSFLQHPTIATFYEAGESDAVAFIAMEYVEGETLRQRIAARTPSPSNAVALIIGTLEALTHAHANGVVHGDVKPENIMLSSTGAIKRLDFGLSRLVDRDDGHAGMLCGTAGYMAPEQIHGEPISPASDIFAARAVLYEMLSGRRRFRARRHASAWPLFCGRVIGWNVRRSDNFVARLTGAGIRSISAI